MLLVFQSNLPPLSESVWRAWALAPFSPIHGTRTSFSQNTCFPLLILILKMEAAHSFETVATQLSAVWCETQSIGINRELLLKFKIINRRFIFVLNSWVSVWQVEVQPAYTVMVKGTFCNIIVWCVC